MPLLSSFLAVASLGEPWWILGKVSSSDFSSDSSWLFNFFSLSFSLSLIIPGDQTLWATIWSEVWFDNEHNRGLLSKQTQRREFKNLQHQNKRSGCLISRRGHSQSAISSFRSLETELSKKKHPRYSTAISINWLTLNISQPQSLTIAYLIFGHFHWGNLRSSLTKWFLDLHRKAL